MKRLLRQLLRMALSVVIVAAVLPSVAVANTSARVVVDGKMYAVETVKDDAGVRTVKVTGEGEDSTVSIDKKSGAITGTTHQNGTTARFVARSRKRVSAASIIDSNADMYWRHRYSVDKRSSTTTVWHTEKSPTVFKNTTETSVRRDDLLGFADAVDACRRNEVTAIGMVGPVVAATVAGIIGSMASLGVTAIIAILTVLGAAVAAAGYFYNAWQDKRDADFHFARY